MRIPIPAPFAGVLCLAVAALIVYADSRRKK